MVEIAERVGRYRRAAQNAQEAGFDGVELHGGNGYLIDQFLQDGSNQRTDEYGGEISNRMRFPLQVVDALIEVWGAGRVGVRISPALALNGMHDSDPKSLFTSFATALSDRKILYIHLVEPQNDDHRMYQGRTPLRHLEGIRASFSGLLMINGGFSQDSAEAYLRDQKADLISFGEPFIANPDLPYRFKHHVSLSKGDPTSYYGGTERGYTDYPTHQEIQGERP